MKSWTWRKNWMHPTIIDNMLNLELLFWAGKNGGKRAFYEHAYQHATTTQREHVRPNHTSYHVINYDTATGKPLVKVTDQGLSDSSTWARGQAWGIYGFAMAHRETKNIKFLMTAKQMADVFMANLPEDNVPYWDFSAKREDATPRDASAAAIAASGLLEISRLSKDPVDELTYRDYAVKLLTALSTQKYLAPDNSPAILQHSTGSLPHNSEIDISIIYADYYYVEALMRLKNMKY
jgi:unsaturated chondroitin disaccharide hydrolase